MEISQILIVFIMDNFMQKSELKTQFYEVFIVENDLRINLITYTFIMKIMQLLIITYLLFFSSFLFACGI